MSATSSMLSEAELHGLVDGQVEAERRADLMRRAVASPTDRERIEAWQEQADMIRGAFRGVDREPVPTVLNLRSPARLHCVSDPLGVAGQPAGRRRISRLTRTLAGLVAGFAVASLMAVACWPWESIAPEKRAPIDLLAGASGLGDGQLIPVSLPRTTPAVAMPATTIPDLTFAGFTFIDAETRLAPAVSLYLHYRDTQGSHLTVAIRRAGTSAATQPAGGLVWRSGRADYAVSGDVGSDRLRAIGVALRDELQDE